MTNMKGGKKEDLKNMQYGQTSTTQKVGFLQKLSEAKRVRR